MDVSKLIAVAPNWNEKVDNESHGDSVLAIREAFPNVELSDS
jgi:hypothetical protein